MSTSAAKYGYSLCHTEESMLSYLQALWKLSLYCKEILKITYQQAKVGTSTKMKLSDFSKSTMAVHLLLVQNHHPHYITKCLLNGNKFQTKVRKINERNIKQHENLWGHMEQFLKMSNNILFQTDILFKELICASF